MPGTLPAPECPIERDPPWPHQFRFYSFALYYNRNQAYQPSASITITSMFDYRRLLDTEAFDWKCHQFRPFRTALGGSTHPAPVSAAAIP